MKCVIPEISYHNRDPVLSVDFQVGLITTRIISSLIQQYLITLLTAPQAGQPTRLATAGSDTHVVIWGVRKDEEEDDKVDLFCLSDLTR